MKKQLLLGSALFAAISVFPQNGRVKPKLNGVTDITARMLAKERPSAVESAANPKLNPGSVKNELEYGPTQNEKILSSTIVWNKVGGSMNIFGMLVANSKPLQYNANLNAVSFVHRKSATYTAAPVSNSGAIVTEVSTNWGTSWDSTCIWSDGTNLARYPQGAIYSAPGNTNIANAYAVGSGPVTTGSGWVGNWYASKQLGTYNNVASATPNAMQFMAIVPTNTAVGKHEFSRLHFSSTNDGIVRSIGMINNDGTGTTFATIGRRGAAVVKGTFNAGVFTWTSDSIICPAALRTDGGKTMGGTPMMAWNDAGTVGYVVFIGSRSGAIGSNFGWQPIVFKTTNSGASWAVINGIDFNCPFYQPIKDHIPAIWSSTLATTPVLPFFNEGEDIDVTVDANNKLHIFTTIVGSGSSNVDSVTAGYTFDAVEKYSWAHTPGDRPYLYDFVGDGTGNWGYMLVDSMSSEGPGSATTDNGYNDNPWDADPANSNAKVTISARLQMSRTPGGTHIVYTWAESDTNFTNSAKKWNNIPNLKARCYDVAANKLSALEINITKPVAPNVANPNVSSRAMFHYTSPKAGAWQGTASTGTLNVPLTVSNSNPYSQLTSNTHWYSTAKLEFNAFTGSSVNYPGSCITSVKDNNSLANEMAIYPNPASGSAVLAINLTGNTAVNITVLNALGQLVKTTNAQGQVGNNDINIDLTGLATGIYMVNIKTGNTTTTKKLIIQ